MAPLSIPKPVPALTVGDIARFQSHLRRDETTGCLLWIASRIGWGGYGQFWIGSRTDGSRKRHLAHRIAWVIAGNIITSERPYILHNCPAGDDPACCEPTHLWAGTIAENQADMARKGRAHKSPVGLPFGVRPNGEKFWARVGTSGGALYLGTFDTLAEAAEAARTAKLRHYGES